MGARILSSTDGKADEPQNQEHGGGDPQEMEREPGSEEDQYEQQCKK
jgi:hypothetical protein